MALAAKAMVSKSKRVMIVDWVRKFEILENESCIANSTHFHLPTIRTFTIVTEPNRSSMITPMSSTSPSIVMTMALSFPEPDVLKK